MAPIVESVSGNGGEKAPESSVQDSSGSTSVQPSSSVSSALDWEAQTSRMVDEIRHGGVDRLREVFTQAVDVKALAVVEKKLAAVKEEIAAWERKEITLSAQKVEELEEAVAAVEKEVDEIVASLM